MRRRVRVTRARCCWPLTLPLAAHAAARHAATPGIPAFAVQSSGGGQTYTLTIELLALMTAITLLPAALLMMTAFTRIIIVLSILRQALGAGQSPPNQVLVGLALFLTLFVMSPVLDKIRTDAVTPYMAGTIDTSTALERGVAPLKSFMLAQTREADIATFARISGGKGFATPAGCAADASWCRRSSPASSRPPFRSASCCSFRS